MTNSLIKFFEIIFLEEVREFLVRLDSKHSEKILYNIRKVQYHPERELFKPLTKEIWEFKTIYEGKHYRLLSFWENEGKEKVMVIATNAFIKKSRKTPTKEIVKAEKIRAIYLNQKGLK